MSLKLGINTRSPLHLVAFDTRLLLLTFREPAGGRRVAVVSVQVGDELPQERELAAGDELVIGECCDAPRRLKVGFTQAAGVAVSLDEVGDGSAAQR